VKDVVLAMEAEGDPDEFNNAMTPGKKALMAEQLSKNAGFTMDPDDLDVRAVASTSPMGYSPLQLLGGQFTSASADIKYMTILITIKGKPGSQGATDAFKSAATALPVAQMSEMVGAKVTSSPKVSELPMDEKFEKDAKERSDNAAEALKKAEEEVKEIFEKGDEKNKENLELEGKAEKAQEKEKAKKREAKNEEKAKQVNKDLEEADKIQKESKEKAAKEENPDAGTTWSDGPHLVNSSPIAEGEPCKVLLQATMDGPCWEQRAFRSKVSCAEGLTCGPDKDLGAISYYQESGAVSTEIPGTVVYCTPAGKAKLTTP
jgi:chemotaxis protein histidine kinase CheA